MNLVIDYTSNQQFSVSQLQSIQEINQITFIVPIFIFFQNNFRLLYNYAQLLSHRPLIKTTIKPIATQDQIKQLQEHNVVLVRGTFDHMHLGHQILLLKAIYSTSHKLIIQVKDDSIMNNKRLKQLIQPIDVRKDNIKKFIQGLKQQIQVKIQVITQPYGSAPYTKGIDAIVITIQSIHSLKHINNLRKSNNGFKKVDMIISPLLTSIIDEPNSKTKKQQIIDSKLSSFRTRQFLLKSNNFTLNQYLDYRAIWDSLVKQINSLCRIKDVDFIIVQKWWERIVYKHSRKALGKKIRKNNKEIYLEISKQNNVSTPNQHSLNQIATNLALLLDGIEEQEKNLQGVVRNFLQNLLKKKGKTKTCKKIRKMILNDIKQFVQKSNSKKVQGGRLIQNETLSNTNSKLLANQDLQNMKSLQNITNNVNTNNDSSFQTQTTYQQNKLNDQKDQIVNTSQQLL